MKQTKLYILEMPTGRLYTIEAYNIDHLQMQLNDHPFFDRHGKFHEPVRNSNNVTEYKEITADVRKALEKERGNKHARYF